MTMRFLIAFCLFSVFFASEVISSEGFPFTAVVLAPETTVRSGPGLEFYVTSTLKQGDHVEVYSETEDYFAIRPPKDSFSWVSARYVNLSEQNGVEQNIRGAVGIVAVDGLAARIGSRDTEQCDTVQVKLKKGEKVYIYGQKETPENNASPLWLKIAPPSGEFRWISRSALEAPTSAPVLIPANEPIAAPKPVRLPIKTGPIRQVNYETEAKNAKAKDAEVKDAGVPAKLGGENSTPVLNVEKVSEKPVPTDVGAKEIAPLSMKLASSQPEQVKIQPRPIPSTQDDPFYQAFEELKAEARTVMTKPTEDWVFETLIQYGNELYEIAPTKRDLEKVYHLVEALERTRAVRQEIAMRRQFRTGALLAPPSSASAASMRSAYQRTSLQNAPQNTNNTTSTNSTPTLNTTKEDPIAIPADRTQIKYGFNVSGFDVVGQLGEFDSPPEGHPRFAVVDEERRILCLISPADSVNLKKHVGDFVGINGALGIFEKPGQQNQRHISAQSVWTLE